MAPAGAETQRLTLAQLEHFHAEFDEAVSETPDIDRYCSSSHWVIPAHLAFHPDAEPVLFALPSGFGALLIEHTAYWGRMLIPMEASWCLACPLVGSDPLALTMGLRQVLTRAEQDWDTALISGLVPDGLLYRALLAAMNGVATLYRGPVVTRTIADLAEGRDGWLARRSSRFRNNIRRTERRCREAGIVLETHRSPDADWPRLLARAMAVESRSWKGRDRAGVDHGPMRSFYDHMIARLGPAGRCRLIFASRGGADLGFILGGVHHGIYRGLQFSFDDDWRALSLGNLLQTAMIETMSVEGIAVYDLGTDMGYKRRWADRTLETVSILMRR